MRLFNRKVDQLKRSRFTQEMFAKKPGVTLTWDEHGGRVDFQGPVGEDVDAMVLTLRFLLQARENISLDQMKKLYEDLPGDHPSRQKFLEAIPVFLAHLDKPAMPHLLGFHVDPATGKHEAPLSNLGILEHVIYGEKAHANPDKEPRMQFMRQTPETSALLDLAFNSAAIDLLRGLFFLQHHNALLFEHYTGEVLPVHNRGKA
ncbi:MAG: hypothetical protein QOI63_154 [Thermoplasmata archaeon]|jgi:hypothetical protein|nr:hypothetical protein [Thermoplasmata archaeon]